MTVSARKIDERLKLKGENRKQKIMVYLPNELSTMFKRICSEKGFALTAVIEELVREYVNDSAEPKKK